MPFGIGKLKLISTGFNTSQRRYLIQDYNRIDPSGNELIQWLINSAIAQERNYLIAAQRNELGDYELRHEVESGTHWHRIHKLINGNKKQKDECIIDSVSHLPGTGRHSKLEVCIKIRI